MTAGPHTGVGRSCYNPTVTTDRRDVMEEFWPWVSQGGGYLIVIAAACASIGAAANHVREWVTIVRRPHNELLERVDDIDDKLGCALRQHDEYEQRFARDLKRHEKNAEESKILLRGMLTLIASKLEGNHVEELEKRRDEIQSYLINKQ